MVVRSTIYEVARRSGVSTATVSRVMAEGKGFSAETGERVRATAAELGWVPNGPARGLASRRTGIVGLIFPDLGGGSGQAHEESALYVDQVIRGAERAATAAGDAVLIAATQCTSGRKLAFSVAGKVDGLVILARSLPDDDVVALSRIVPVVMLANRLARKGPDYVEADNRGGSRAITAHLITVHGYTDLVFLAGPEQSPDSEERFAGFRDALAHAGLGEPDRPVASGDFTESGGETAVRDLLAPRSAAAGDRVRQRRDGAGSDDRAAVSQAARAGGRRRDGFRRHLGRAARASGADDRAPAHARTRGAIGAAAVRPDRRP